MNALNADALYSLYDAATRRSVCACASEVRERGGQTRGPRSKGQIVGLCGNSGNSSEPHLHYHLQNSTMLAEAFGIKVRFATVKLLRDGKAEMRTGYSPIKGDIVSAE